jgi:hypothetical protein
MSPVPEPINYQTGRREKTEVITAIAIGIQAILATSATAAHMASSSNGSYDKVELREMEDKVNVIKSRHSTKYKHQSLKEISQPGTTTE